MKRKIIALLCIVLSLIILQVNVRISNAQEEVNLFDEILLQTKSKTVEYGLKTCFDTKEGSKEICNYLIKDLELSNKEIKLNISENKGSYCIEFTGENVEGYIEALKYKSDNAITINISKSGSENELVSLKNKVSTGIGHRGTNIKYYQYLKAKLGTDTQNGVAKSSYGVNETIIKILKSRGAKNIETVNINNGLSTIAYTQKYDALLINNELIDFNYAVCNYSSGRYVIIGTPQIITTY